MTTVDVVIASPVVVDVVAGVPMPAGAHAGTHETGGSDPITDLDAAVITSGVFDPARLPAIPPAAPLAHHVSHELGGSDVVTLAQSQVTGLSSALAGKVDTTDPRLSDARPPTAHHGTHDTGGSDPIAALDAAVIATGTINAARLPATAPSAHHVSHETGGADAIAALSAGVLNSGTLSNARLASDVAVTSSVAIGTNPATVGTIRLPNTGSLRGRNAANTADFTILQLYSDDKVYVGSNATDQGLVLRTIGGTIVFQTNSGDRWTINAAGTFYPAADAGQDVGGSGNRIRNAFVSGAVSIGTNPASTGAIRLANAAQIMARNAANTADCNLIQIDSGNNVVVGGTTNIAGLYLRSVTPVTIGGSGGDRFTVDSAGIYPKADNTYDVGFPATFRIRNIYIAGAVANRTKAGTPVDADVNTPTDGMLIVDTTANKIWVRIGGVWKGATVA